MRSMRRNQRVKQPHRRLTLYLHLVPHLRLQRPHRHAPKVRVLRCYAVIKLFLVVQLLNTSIGFVGFVIARKVSPTGKGGAWHVALGAHFDLITYLHIFAEQYYDFY